MVSVIIPVYNAEKYLPACLESVCGQTLSDLEIVLVDDGSTDRSGEICEEYAKKDRRITVIHQENGGHTSARSRGLKAARGEYIGFVDSDDWIEPTMYEDMLSVCIAEDADIVISNFYFERKKGTRKNVLPVSEGLYQTADHSMDQLLQCLFFSDDYKKPGIGGYLWNKLFQKDLLCKYQFQVDPRIMYHEDEACTFPCILNASRVAVMDRAYYHYRIRDGSICRASDERYFERTTYLYQQLKAAVAEHPRAEALMEQLNYHMLDCVLGGVNGIFGFGFGKAVPSTILPYDLPQRNQLKTVILYGAGEIGRRYYRWYEETSAVKIAAWVDRSWEKCQAEGLPVQPLSACKELEYDGVLIAVGSADLAEEIARDLEENGIPGAKIFYEPPENLLHVVQTWQGQNWQRVK